MAGEAVEPAGAPTTAVFFHRCNSELPANHCSSYPQPSVVFTLLLFAAEIVTKSHGWSEGRDQLNVGCPTPINMFTTHPLHVAEEGSGRL